MSHFISRRRIKDILASKTMLVLTLFTAAIILLMIAGLYLKSMPVLARPAPWGNYCFPVAGIRFAVNSGSCRSLWAPCG